MVWSLPCCEDDAESEASASHGVIDAGRHEALFALVDWLDRGPSLGLARWPLLGRRALTLAAMVSPEDAKASAMKRAAAEFGCSVAQVKADADTLAPLLVGPGQQIAAWISEKIIGTTTIGRDPLARAARRLNVFLAAIRVVTDDSGEALARRYGVTREQIRHDRDAIDIALFGRVMHRHHMDRRSDEDQSADLVPMATDSDGEDEAA